MDPTSLRILQWFAESANKLHLQSEDFVRFFQFSLYAHDHALEVTGYEVRALLRCHGFSMEAALRLALEYGRCRKLLRAYYTDDVSAVHA